MKIDVMKAVVRLVLLSFAVLVISCSDYGKDKQTVDFSPWEKAYLLYSYPSNGQQNVSSKSAISLYFSHAIEDNDLTSHIRLIDSEDNIISGDIKIHEENQAGVVFTPSAPLSAGSNYRLRYDGVTTSLGEISDPRDIVFTTKNSNAGAPSAEPEAENDFKVIREFPSAELPFMDFSVIHLTFNQAIDSSSVKVDESFKFIEAGQTQSVKGKIIAKDNYLIFDPETDLNPGTQYTLSLTNSIRSRSGAALVANEYFAKNYTPQDSQPRSTLVQKIEGKPGENFSPLSGFERNTVPVNSTLMGNVVSFAQADYHTELAFIPNFPDAAPFVIRKGSVVTGSSMQVNIGGLVPAGFETGNTYLTLITDATGYLVPNQNTDDPNAPRQVQLVMNVAMTAEDPRANGGLSQDVLHIDLFGIGKTENGVLVIDTLGEINPLLLGIEKSYGLVSFFLEAYADQKNTPSPVVDDTSPSLQNWLPGDYVGLMSPSDPIVLIFDEAIAPESLADNISLSRDGNVPIAVTLSVDGSSVIIRPESPLEYGHDYDISIGVGLSDLTGNTLSAPLSKAFSLPEYSQQKLAAPLIGSIYPGYPCRLTGGNLSAGIAGRCEGGKASDDIFNIFKLPANRAIQINFNQTMKTETFSLGKECNKGSIRVERIDTDGNCSSAVKGSIHFDGSRLSFEPAQAWQDDTLYRFSLNSSNSSACNGLDEVICSEQGLPLRTNPLTLTAENKHQGSGSLSIPFRASQAEFIKVFNPLNQVPTADINRNFAFDDLESPEQKNSAKLTIADTGGLISEARMGCLSGECESKKSIYLSGFLPTEIGLYDELTNRIPVNLYSQVLMTSSITMYAKVLFSWLETPTGPQIMRMRHEYDETTGEYVPSKGYIEWDPNFANGDGTFGKSVFTSTMRVYLDAPGLEPKLLGIGLSTNLHSYPMTIELSGPINFLPDGRMEILLENTNNVDIDIKIAAGTASVDLEIRPGDLAISLISKMAK